ncbi:hypothetical protein IFR05_017466 [Cadophora sp. M221]|nr:hypothetical protein IFR05_017466 [Cadophora sp. M221]
MTINCSLACSAARRRFGGSVLGEEWLFSGSSENPSSSREAIDNLSMTEDDLIPVYSVAYYGRKRKIGIGATSNSTKSNASEPTA